MGRFHNVTGGSNIKPRQLKALVLLLALLPLAPTVLTLRLMVESTRQERGNVRNWIEQFYDNHLDTVTSYLKTYLRDEFSGINRAGTGAALTFDLASSRLVDGVVLYDAAGRAMPVPAVPEAGEVLRGARDLGDFLDRSREASGRHPALAPLNDIAPDRWTPLPGTPDLMARILPLDADRTALLLRTRPHLLEKVRNYYLSLLGTETKLVLATDSAESDAALTYGGGPIASAELQPILPEWRAYLYLPETTNLDAPIKEQVVTYRIIGASIVIGILLIAVLAAYAVNRQLRLNEIRNTELAALAHELKTPISSSKVLIETLQESPQSLPLASAREYIDLLERENSRLARTVSDFLTISRTERKDYAPRRALTHPAEIVQDALATMRLPLEEAGFHVEVATPPGLPRLLVDREAMTSVLLNLIENAIKYSETRRVLKIAVHAAADRVHFAVSDGGIGIPRKALRKIFKPFHQIDDRLSRRREGCGLGLNIVHNIVRANCGRVWAESRPGEGSTFHIEFPAAERIDAPAAPHRDAAVAEASKSTPA